MVDRSKFKFYKQGSAVIAVSSYAGKTVRGIAKCNPNDEFNLDFGEDLAAARAKVKIEQKRMKHAQIQADQAKRDLEKAMKHYAEMTHYEASATASYNEAEFVLANVLSMTQ